MLKELQALDGALDVSKLDAIDPAGEWHDSCFCKLRKIPGPFQSQTLLKLHVFSIDSFQQISYKESNVQSRVEDLADLLEGPK